MRRIWIYFSLLVGCAHLGAPSVFAQQQQRPIGLQKLGELMERDWKEKPEWAEMATAILKTPGMGMGAGNGWFKPSQTRYTWDWLKENFDVDRKDGRVSRKELQALSDEEFRRLDRTGNGSLNVADFDWTRGNEFMAETQIADQVFDTLDADANGKITFEEFQQLVKDESGGFEFLTLRDIRSAFRLKPVLSPPANSARRRAPPQNAGPPEMVRLQVLQKLLNGEMGMFAEGPSVGDDAPKFKLPLVELNADGDHFEVTKKFVSREDSIRKGRPMMLVFGSFT